MNNFPQSNFAPSMMTQPVSRPTQMGVYQQQAQTNKGPDIWYRPVTQNDYPKLSEIGTATIVVRFLPGFNQQGIYESICEKNNTFSKFPNSKQWLVPVLVMADMLHPEKNGFVGVMTVSKTLYNRIKNKSTPQNYCDFNNGYNFHINVSLQQSKDGSQVFPNYAKSGFENNPSQCQVDYVVPKMNEGKFSDFALFMQRINNPKQQSAGQIPQVPMGAGMQPQVIPTSPLKAPQQFNAYAQTGYTTYPTQCGHNSPMYAPVAQTQPALGQIPPVANSGMNTSEEEFDQIFNA